MKSGMEAMTSIVILIAIIILFGIISLAVYSFFKKGGLW